jgi:Domain of unknown function (DUF4303)
MKWFTNLFKKDNSPSLTKGDEFGDSSNLSSSIDWLFFENSLVRLLETDIANFAKQHPEEIFYGLALDCNAANCDVLLCANTPIALRDAAITYSRDGTEQSIATESEELRWGLGDWKYHGINFEPRENWLQYHSALSGIDELQHPEDLEQFLASACRALLKLERNDVLQRLKRTPDFRLACIDHDESISDSDERLNALRKATT